MFNTLNNFHFLLDALCREMLFLVRVLEVFVVDEAAKILDLCGFF